MTHDSDDLDAVDREMMAGFRQAAAPFLVVGDFRSEDGPAPKIDMTRQTIHKRLEQLAESGHLERRACGGSWGYWLPSSETEASCA